MSCGNCEDGQRCGVCSAVLSPLAWTGERPKEPGLYWFRLPEPGAHVWIMRVRRPVFGDGLIFESLNDMIRDYRDDQLNPSLVWCRLPDPPEFRD